MNEAATKANLEIPPIFGQKRMPRGLLKEMTEFSSTKKPISILEQPFYIGPFYILLRRGKRNAAHRKQAGRLINHTSEFRPSFPRH